MFQTTNQIRIKAILKLANLAQQLSIPRNNGGVVFQNSVESWVCVVYAYVFPGIIRQDLDKA